MLQRWVIGFGLGIAILVFAAPRMARAEDTGTTPATDEAEASTPEGAQRVTERIASKFQVEESVVTELRNQQLGYGEITHALSLANQLPGGVTQENIDQVMQMRAEQKMGWGQIAHELDTTLGAATQAPLQEPAPTEPVTTTAQAESLTRSGSSRGSEKGKKGGFFGFGGTNKGASLERAGGAKATGASAAGSHGGGLGGSSGGLGGAKGKSGSAPGHNR